MQPLLFCSRRSDRGFSLLELLITLVQATFLVTTAIPAMQRFMALNTRASVLNRFVTAIQYARSESIKRQHYVAVCKKAATDTQCSGSGQSWRHGWLVFVNRDQDSPVRIDTTDVLLRVFPGTAHTLLTQANRNAFTLRPMGRYSTNGTFIVCSADNTVAARAIIISVTGRPRTSAVAANGSALTCTAL